MSEFRVATRYAKSLLDLAQEKGVLEDVHNDMLLFTDICNTNRAFYLMLKNPIVKSDKKLHILRSLFKGRVNDLTIAFFDIITRKNREFILAFTAKEFHTQYNAIKGVAKATVVTTFPLTENLRTRFREIIKEISGKEAELKEEVSKDIIGGYILRIGDKQIDESISSKLKDLRIKLLENSYVKEF